MGDYPIHHTVSERRTTTYEIGRLLLVTFWCIFSLYVFSIMHTFVLFGFDNIQNDCHAENVLLC